MIKFRTSLQNLVLSPKKSVQIRRYLTGDCASKVIHAFITSRIDYCNHLYYGFPNYQLNKIQRIQNTAARFVTCKGKFDHVTSLLVQLQWLLISYRTVFKLLLLVYKSVNGLCPSYVSDLLKIKSSSRSLRSTSSMDYLMQPALCQRQRPVGTERSLCAHLSCGTVLPFQFVNLAMVQN